MLKSPTVLLCPARVVNHPFAQCVLCPRCRCSTRTSQLVANCQGITALVFQPPLSYLMRAPKCEWSEAGSSDMPKTSHVLPLCGKGEDFDFIKKEKSCMLRLLRSTIRRNLLSVKLPNLQVKLYNGRVCMKKT